MPTSNVFTLIAGTAASPGEPVTVTVSAAEQLLSTSDSSSTGSTHSPTHTVPGDADELTVNETGPRADSPGSSAGTSVASPTSLSEVVITEFADTNVLTLVAGAATLPRLRTVTVYLKLPPAETVTLLGDTLATRSGEPVTVTGKLRLAVSPPGS